MNSIFSLIKENQSFNRTHFSYMSKCLSMLLMLLVIQFNLDAQCPQRYLDQVFQGAKFSKNINYGGQRTNTDGTKTWCVFDIYEPFNDTVQLRPLIFFIHGGSFTNDPPLMRGTPDVVDIAKGFARRGYVVVSPEYRLYSPPGTYQKTVETALAGMIDVNDAACFLVNSARNGNPYRIDTNNFFIGGSSAGAMIALNPYFLNDTSDIPESLKEFARNVEQFDQIDLQKDFLEKRYCGMKPKGIVSISGALFDTSFVKPDDLSVLIIHAKNDNVVPGGVTPLSGNPNSPALFGSEVMDEAFQQNRIRVESYYLDDSWHVPVIWNFSDDLPGAIVQTLLTGSAINPPVMDSTQRQMANLFYDLLGRPETKCTTATSIQQQVFNGMLTISPNPSSGIFSVGLPGNILNEDARIVVYDMSGRIVLSERVNTQGSIALDMSKEPKGMYFIGVMTDQLEGRKIYIDKVVIY
jgi:Secretion system C-terminal sorting domain/alpha/beta hydrolase fold